MGSHVFHARGIPAPIACMLLLSGSTAGLACVVIGGTGAPTADTTSGAGGATAAAGSTAVTGPATTTAGGAAGGSGAGGGEALGHRTALLAAEVARGEELLEQGDGAVGVVEAAQQHVGQVPGGVALTGVEGDGVVEELGAPLGVALQGDDPAEVAQRPLLLDVGARLVAGEAGLAAGGGEVAGGQVALGQGQPQRHGRGLVGHLRLELGQGHGLVLVAVVERRVPARQRVARLQGGAGLGAPGVTGVA